MFSLSGKCRSILGEFPDALFLAAATDQNPAVLFRYYVALQSLNDNLTGRCGVHDTIAAFIQMYVAYSRIAIHVMLQSVMK